MASAQNAKEMLPLVSGAAQLKDIQNFIRHPRERGDDESPIEIH
jgi:hypothetical protein